MGLNCGCPIAEAIPSIVIGECNENVGQVQKVMFQRLFESAGVLNEVNDPQLKASWTALLSAANATKVAITPYLQGPTSEPGAARKFGGGNATVGGVEVVIGREPSTFTASFHMLKQSIVAALKGYMCENVGVYLVDEFGRIIGKNIGTEAVPVLTAIPVRALFIGDKKLGGLEEPDSNAIEWTFEPNWSDTLFIVTPTDFNPLTDLAYVAPTTTTTTV